MGYSFDDNLPHNMTSSHHLPSSYRDQHPVIMRSSAPPNSFQRNAFPRSYNETPQYNGNKNGIGSRYDFDRLDTHDEFLYSPQPLGRDDYADTSHHRNIMYGRAQGADILDDLHFKMDRDYPSPRRSHYQRNVQFIEEDEIYTKPGCIRRSLNEVLDALFPQYRRNRPAEASYPILSPRNEHRFQSSAIHSFDIRESRGSFDSNGSFERARQYMRDVSHRTSDKASELHDQLRAMVQDRALRQTQARDVSTPSAPQEDEKLAESRRMLQQQIEQHQAAMTNHMTMMQTQQMAAMQAQQQQQYHMSPMYNGMVQNGMTNGMMNHQQLNNIFTPSTQEKMSVVTPTMNDGLQMQRDGMSTMQSNRSPQQVYHQHQRQDQRDPSECTPRSNDRSTSIKQRSSTNSPRSRISAGNPPIAVKVANGTKIVFSEQHQQSDASTIQSIQDSVERAMRKSDAARMQLRSSKKLWSQASKIRA